MNPHFIPLEPSRFVYEAEEDGEIDGSRSPSSMTSSGSTCPDWVPGEESFKVHCPGIGLVMDNDLTLIEFQIGERDDDEEQENDD